ncbi:SNAP receptor, partial [Nowakowskiella sp. JEL0078]
MSFGDLERGSGGSDDRSYQIEMDSNRAYLKLWDRASHSVFMISNNVASIQKLVGHFGTTKDTPEMRIRLSKLTDDTRQLIRQTGLDLKNLMTMDGGAQENRQRKIAHQKLQKDFEDVLKRFQNVSKTSAEKARAYVANIRAQNEKAR